MIGVYDILMWINKSQAYQQYFDGGYCGKLDNSREKVLSVYPLRQSGVPYRAFQALESYQKIPVSLLIHYNRNIDDTQRAADAVFQFLRTPSPAENLPLVSNALRVHHIDFTTTEPIFVGTDEKGIFEFVIECLLYVEKENENIG